MGGGTAEGPSLPSLTTPLTPGGRFGGREGPLSFLLDPCHKSQFSAPKVLGNKPQKYRRRLRPGWCFAEPSEGGSGLWCPWLVVAPGTGRTCGTPGREGQTAGKAVGTGQIDCARRRSRSALRARTGSVAAWQCAELGDGVVAALLGEWGLASTGPEL